MTRPWHLYCLWSLLFLRHSWGLASSKPIPITVLSGFLGSGKTSLLQHLLQNKEGLRIAVIVNDVASVNIDSKLIANSAGSAEGASGMVELQNGCACCSLSEELLGSVSELVMMSDLKGDDEGFQHIVIEMSGVADPKSVRAKFQEAILYDMPLMERVRLDTMVTVMDCGCAFEYMTSGKTASPKETPELYYRDGEVPPEPTGDWMDDLPGPLLEAILAGGGNAPIPTTGEEDGVSELMVAQTETADVLLLNKVDLTTEDRKGQLRQLAVALNPKATIYETEHGRVDLKKILAVAGGKGVVESGVVDDHKDAVSFATHEDDCVDQSCDHPSHEHSHEHTSADEYSHEHTSEPSHDHSHDDSTTSHEHSHEHAAASNEHSHDHAEPECTDPSHSHSHDHNTSHSHSHDHEDAACTDPDCADSSHSHSHAHEQHAGIGTFVYRARRPFHPKRLLGLLRELPVQRGLPDANDDGGDESDLELSADTCKALKKVLRSKGFTWCADSNVAALYWSHAGGSFDMQCLGRWWATLPRDDWPPEAVKSLLADFDDPTHVEEDPESDSVGDRRQEIVLIGPGLGGSGDQQSLREGLDACLLNNEEWATFQAKRTTEEELKTAFINQIQARMASY